MDTRQLPPQQGEGKSHSNSMTASDCDPVFASFLHNSKAGELESCETEKPRPLGLSIPAVSRTHPWSDLSSACLLDQRCRDQAVLDVEVVRPIDKEVGDNRIPSLAFADNRRSSMGSYCIGWDLWGGLRCMMSYLRCWRYWYNKCWVLGPVLKSTDNIRLYFFGIHEAEKADDTGHIAQEQGSCWYCYLYPAENSQLPLLSSLAARVAVAAVESCHPLTHLAGPVVSL